LPVVQFELVSVAYDQHALVAIADGHSFLLAGPLRPHSGGVRDCVYIQPTQRPDGTEIDLGHDPTGLRHVLD